MKMRHQHAFSLVEVVIAIGIISFALLAIMGLMASSQKSDREATDDTLLPAMATGALATLRSYYATNALPVASVTTNYYFNSAGTLQTNGTGPISSANADSLYRCQVTISGGLLAASDNMKVLRMRFFRPPDPSNTNSSATIHASLTKE